MLFRSSVSVRKRPPTGASLPLICRRSERRLTLPVLAHSEPDALPIGYLKGHDEVGEVELRLQVQLDGHILNAWTERQREVVQ